MPFTYLSMSATSTDGNAHTLRMYSDISGGQSIHQILFLRNFSIKQRSHLLIEFIAGDTTQLAQWTAIDDGQYTVLNMALQTQRKYTEINQFAQDATEYYAFKKVRFFL